LNALRAQPGIPTLLRRRRVTLLGLPLLELHLLSLPPQQLLLSLLHLPLLELHLLHLTLT
jgi:hypothetical protein